MRCKHCKINNLEFSKKLLIMDYLIQVVLIVCAVIFPEVDFVSFGVGWALQLGVSTGAYYWKARNENRVKIPIKVIESLPEDIRDQLDMTAIITTIIQSD